MYISSLKKTILDVFISLSSSDRSVLLFLWLLPLAALVSATPVDTLLLLVILIGASKFFKDKLIDELKRPWFVFGVAFLLYLFLSTFFASYGYLLDLERYIKIIGALRFPLYAIFIAYYFRYFGVSVFQCFLLSVCLGLCIEGLVLLIEAYLNPERYRLYGTFSNLMPGSYLAVWGLIVLCILHDHLRYSQVHWMYSLLLLFFSIFLAIACFLTGEVFINLFCVFLMNLYFFVSGYYKRPYYFLICFVALILTFSMFSWYDNPALLSRFFQINERVLQPGGDYYYSWWVAFKLAMEHLWLGIGPMTYDLVAISQGYTVPKAHNIYMHYLVESGLVGLIGFCCWVIMIIRYLISQMHGIPFIYWGFPLVACVFSFFPLNSQLEPYAQDSGLEMWIILGVAFYYPTYIRKYFLK